MCRPKLLWWLSGSPCPDRIRQDGRGLAALSAVLGALPADFPFPVLIVQHLDPATGYCGLGSLGRPSTRSPTMLRWISAAPPQIVSDREKKKSDWRLLTA